MPADRLHLVRHGEVHNPRLACSTGDSGFGLSVDGRRMARQAAEYVHTLERPVTSLVCSPLQRTQESAEPFTELFGIEPVIDERVIEPTNVFEGRRMKRALINPLNWRHLRRRPRPAGASRMRRSSRAWTPRWRMPGSAASGDVVIVSHQLPIWVTHLAVSRVPPRHDPRQRRCALSSVTSFERRGDEWVEVGYVEPAATADAVDVGAV